MTNADDIRTPTVPSSMALATSSGPEMPAPQMTGTSRPSDLISLIYSVTTSGFALETEMPVPISSGGSIAT